jgi:peptidyl-prolyl cis-trans isomerase C
MVFDHRGPAVSRRAIGSLVLCILPAATPAAQPEAAPSSHQVPAEAAVATVDGEAITADAVRRALVLQGPKALLPEHAREAKEVALEGLVRTEVLALAARQEGLHQDTETRAAIQQMLAERYRQRMVANLVVEPVGDEEIEAFYQKHSERFTEPLRLRGRVLTLRRGDDAAAVLARAEALRAQAGNEADFERLVRQHSEDPSARRHGGDLGWVSEGASVFRVAPEVIDALFSLSEVGKLAPVVESEREIHLVMLTGRQGGDTLPLAVAAGEIRRELERQRREEALDREIAAVRERFEIEIDHDLLEHIGPSDLADAAQPPSFPVGDPTP